MPARPLVVEKAEEPVLAKRPSNRSPELVPAQGRLQVGERVSRVELVVTEVFKQRSVEPVGSRLGGGLHHGSGGLAKFRVVVAGGHLEVLQRVKVGVDDGDAQDGAVVFRSVDQKSVGKEKLAVHVYLDAALWILARSMLPPVHLRPGHHQEQFGQIPVENRKLFEFAPRQRRAHLGTVSLEHGRLSSHVDGARSPSQRQGRINSGRRINLHVRLGHEFREARGCHFHFIMPGQQVRLDVVAVGVGPGLVREPAVHVGDEHVRLGDRSAARITHGADDVAGYGLPKPRVFEWDG